MKLNPIGSNQNEVILPNGITILFSYKTPVAAFVSGRGGLATDTFYSRTTSKHIGQAMARWGCSRTVVAQSEINSLSS